MWEVVPYPMLDKFNNRVIDSQHEQGFFDGSCHGGLFSDKDLEDCQQMLYGHKQSWYMDNWRRCLYMLLESLSQGSPRLSHIFFKTAKLITPVTVDNTYIKLARSHPVSFGDMRIFFNVLYSFEINSYAIFSANVLWSYSHKFMVCKE